MRIIGMCKTLFFKVRLLLADREQTCQLIRKRGVKCGRGCDINKNVDFGSEPYLITIGNDVRITDGVRFITHDGGIWVLRNTGQLSNADKFGEIVVKDNVHIGMNSIIMPGVTIGNNVIIGCASVITKDVPDNSVVAGVSGRVIESINDYFLKNKNKCDFTKNLSPDEKKKYLIQKYKR